jgi:hypothetical protein
MFRSFVICAALCAISSSAFAQENLVGKWGGNYIFRGSIRGDVTIGLDLEITSVEGNVVKGVLRNYSNRGCNGEFQMVGKLDGNELGMRATEAAGPNADCKMGFRATVDGTKMTGKLGSMHDLNLNKK